MTRLAHTVAAMAIGCVTLAAPHAGAEAQRGGWLAGSWKFETAPINDRCTLSGRMTFIPTDRSNVYDCRFESRQLCAGADPVDIRMRQTCIATVSDPQITITSIVEEPISVAPDTLEPFIMERYAPDNFQVSRTPGSSELRGMFHSLSRAYVRFWRDEDLLS
ncbi:hypothetical protein GC169_07335 [bacterium]|nr:hypothetical protein [bacterium]